MNKKHHFRRQGIVRIVCVFFILATLSCTDESEDTKGTDISVGMNLSSFKKLYPETDRQSSDQIRRTESLKGLQGEWTYAFREGKLSWYVFNAYDETVTRERFDVCLEAANALIDRYRSLYGPPVRLTKGITEFADPAAALHDGYEVISAEWRTGESVITVRFNFIGDRSKYAFLVTAEGKRI